MLLNHHLLYLIQVYYNFIASCFGYSDISVKALFLFMSVQAIMKGIQIDLQMAFVAKELFLISLLFFLSFFVGGGGGEYIYNKNNFADDDNDL